MDCRDVGPVSAVWGGNTAQGPSILSLAFVNFPIVFVVSSAMSPTVVVCVGMAGIPCGEYQ